MECEECRQAYELMVQDFAEDIWKVESISERTRQTKKRRFIRRVKKLLFLLGGILAYIGLMIGIIALVLMYLSGA